ncbi:uncharacterized protein LOC123537039 [Mercenaria mercenaria]|uniref:uncharacterized protein LOC123537039 n=1 Tax=Mercenaria mercenaria TaxID=6596 RepID=UPI00234E3DC4|nr:uncharacterized protein LOC123537039 [Mercenaria mercenaria]
MQGNREMTTLQYLNGMVLLHGGCTQRDVERLAKLGICVVPQTVSDKLQSWQENLDNDLLEVKNKWITGGNRTYQLVGDNWDKNIIPSYRTSQQETQSLHLFNVIGVIDRIVVEKNDSTSVKAVESLSAADFIPSVNDLELLRDELTFIVARSVIENNEQMRKTLGNLYPDHLKHCYSDYAGMKTSQCSLGLFDCDEKKTQDVIQLLKLLSEKFVPKEGEEIIEEVFFGGDRLTDERIQLAQKAMSNADSGLERLEGFISKIEDFHRLMNFLEAIHRTTYNTESSRDRGTIYYYRNFLNARNVKGGVKNSYRAYKHLYYTVFDAMCCVLFLNNFGLDSAESEIPLPKDFDGWTNECQIDWINSVCRNLLNKVFFEDDMFMELREILTNPDHEENYWISSLENDRFKCHFCNSSYSYVDSLKAHEKNEHGFQPSKQNSDKTLKKEASDELHDYVLSLFRLTALHKNLDSAVDMGDGYRVVRSAKYETPFIIKPIKSNI